MNELDEKEVGKNIKILKEKFLKEIRPYYHKSQRSGYTGVGYTFEKLLGKEEDRSSTPDFHGIEIKTHMGYSKNSITLFSLSPTRENAIKEIYEKYSYPNTKDRRFKSFKGNAFCKEDYLIAFKYYFKLKVDYEEQKLRLFILNNQFEVVNTSIFWDFEQIKNRLFTKIKYLAYINAYPYRIDDELCYKYANIKFYKLKSFSTFLKLIEKDIVHVAFNIDTYKSGERFGTIKDHGTSFRIKPEHLEELFRLIY